VPRTDNFGRLCTGELFEEVARLLSLPNPHRVVDRFNSYRGIDGSERYCWGRQQAAIVLQPGASRADFTEQVLQDVEERDELWSRQENRALFDGALAFLNASCTWACKTARGDADSLFQQGLDDDGGSDSYADDAFACIKSHSPLLASRDAGEMAVRFTQVLVGSYTAVFRGMCSRAAKWTVQTSAGFAACVDRIKQLDQDSQKYERMRNEPLTPGGQLHDTVLDPAYFGARIRRVMEFSRETVPSTVPI
jgi:hypothetical protein